MIEAAAAVIDAAAILGRPLELRRGPVIKNRFCKSAMSEAWGTDEGAPRPGLDNLYRTWAEGGLGLAVTGNVMVDRGALGEPGNVVVDDERDLELLRAWAEAGQVDGGRIWMQINHPGKQSPKFMSPEPVAPSAVPLAAKLAPLFNPPRALEADEIEALVRAYGRTAAVVQKAGFDGVQIHGAHGYLVNQFLSPHHNQRDDAWGGTAEKRMRFVLEVIAAMRSAVGEDFPIGLKLNSADFQRGGFSEAESMAVVQAVEAAGVDLVEISGGSYEAPAMTGIRAKESTLKREAYFLDYARRVRQLVKLPLVVTGGFRSAAGMAAAVQSGDVDMVGLARPLAVEPDLPDRILQGEDFHSLVRPIRTGLDAIDKRGILELSWYNRQLARMCAGKAPLPGMGAWRSLAGTVFAIGWKGLSRTRA